LVIALSLCLVLPSCGLLHRRHHQAMRDDGPKGPSPVGVVDLINPEAHFVLVHLSAKGVIPPVGVVLRCIGATGETARLVVTPERKDMHITADIKSGEPQRNDLVIFDVATASPVKSSAGASGVSAGLGPATSSFPKGGLINGLPDPATAEGGGVPSVSAPANGMTGSTLPITGNVGGLLAPLPLKGR
jgi:hypothetical protein